MTAETFPFATSWATAWWPAFGSAPVQPAAPEKARRQASRRMSSRATKSWNWIGFIRLQTPPGLRKSGIPDSVDIPAPVNTTTFCGRHNHRGEALAGRNLSA